MLVWRYVAWLQTPVSLQAVAYFHVARICCLQRGKGVEVNQRLSLELFRRASELGDAEAQGATAMRMAFGLQYTNSFEGASLRHFGRVGVSD